MSPRLLLLAAGLASLATVTPDQPGRDRDVKALAPFAGLVGDWKGTGQVRRGKSEGAWRESGAWSWSFTHDAAALKLDLSDGKHLKSARLTADPNERFTIQALLPDDSTRRFHGALNASNRLTLTAVEPVADGPARLTLTPLHDSRFLLLIEAPGPTPATFQRIAEVGYTRQGIAFATRSDGPECIVTGGKGTIAVTHAGKTYKVCCTGCRDLFNDDPEGTLADARRDGRIK